MDWVQQTFEKSGDPWFRKTLTEPDSLDAPNLVESKERLSSLLAGNVVPQIR